MRLAPPAICVLILALAVAYPAGQGPGGGGRGAGGPGGPPGQGPGGGPRGGGARGPANNNTTVVGTGGLSGSVVLLGSGTPVRRATIRLTAPELRGTRTAVTDEAGQFTFQALPAGRFTMTASKAGFVDAAYGAKQPGRPGTPIQLADGQRLEKLVISIPRGSVITGIVIDENGEPAPDTPVRAMRYVMRTGEKTLQQTGQAMSDDRGIYRIYSLEPGDYLVSAIPRNQNISDLRQSITTEINSLVQQAQAQGLLNGRNATTTAAGNGDLASLLAGLGTGGAGQQMADRLTSLQQQLSQMEPDQSVAYAPVYYPGTTSPSQAQTVTIGVSQERSGVDFRLQQVPTTRLSGSVLSPDGTIPQGTQVALVSTDRAGMPSIPGVGTNMGRAGGDGRFTFSNVTPGQYSVQARAVIRKPDTSAATNTTPQNNAGGRGGRGGPGGFGPGGPGGAIAQVLWAAADVTIGGQTPPDVVLNLQPGMTISGHVEFQGSLPPPPDLTRVRVTLSTRGSQMFDLGLVPPGDVDATGRFTITGVAPGRYMLSASAPAAQTTTSTVGAAAGAAAGGRAGRGGTATAAQGAGRGGAFGGATTVGTPGASGQWVLKSAMVSGRDSLDFPFEIGPNQDVSGATLVFTDRTQALSGTIQDSSGRATADYTIIVFPSDQNYWLPQARRIAAARPGTDGKFSFGSLPAGSYRLTAVTDVEPGEWYDPTFLTQLVPASLPISIAEGEKKVQDIKVAGGG